VGAYNCRPITGGTKYSLHAYGIALDINWQANPYGKKLITDMPPDMRAAIKAIRTTGGHQVWRWGGDYSGNKDAMHFEVVASPGELASGIDPSTIPGSTPAPSPLPEDDDMPRPIVYVKPDDKRWPALYPGGQPIHFLSDGTALGTQRIANENARKRYEANGWWNGKFQPESSHFLYEILTMDGEREDLLESFGLTGRPDGKPKP
jgi:hypothetical protein